jgi:magnesium chelatase accessory protein
MDKAAFWEREKGAWPLHEFSRFVVADGIRWHVQQQGSGPALLLVHGTGASTHSWRDVMPLLARTFSVVAVDLPGHAFTQSVLPWRSSLGAMSASLAALLTVLGVRPGYCVGHSAGAAIICRMTLDGLIAPRGLASINGAFLPFAGAAGVFFAPIAKLLGANPLLPRLIAWRAGDTAFIRRLVAGTGSTLDARGVDLYARLVRCPSHVAAAFAMMGHWDLQSLERDLPRLAVPLTLIVGENDRSVPPQQALRIQQRLAASTLERLPRLGHLAHEEAPAQVADLVLAAARAAGIDSTV